MDDKNKPVDNIQDQELANLLDNALQDFTTESSSKTETTVLGKSQTDEKNVTATETVPQEWSEEFVQQAASQFEENFAKLLNATDKTIQINPDVIQEKIKQIADAAQQVVSNPSEISDQSLDFASSISQALAGLSQGQENLNTAMNEDDLLNMFGNSSSDGNFLPFMQGMMQGLLSKEVLGPSLEELVQKLPVYLEANKEKLSKEDVERYQKQKELMEEILAELNKENEADNKDMKKERFSTVLGLMQKLQEYGPPPKELVGDVETPFLFDGAGNLSGLPTGGLNPNQECSIM